MAFAQAESTSTLEPLLGISETYVEGKHEHGTREVAAAVHKHSVFIPRAEATRRLRSHCGV